MTESQANIDARNAAFWDELCGSTLAQQLGIEDASRENLERFDDAYMAQYPYLERYLPTAGEGRGGRLLEIGLGYGTVSQILAERGFDYNGIDIAAGPVEMVRNRLAMLGIDEPENRVRVGSVLELPHPDEGFDHVVTIGCLHHTGNVERAVEEVQRVLKPGGSAAVMLYNRRSFRQMKLALTRLPGRLGGSRGDDEQVRAAYDTDSKGAAAPATEYVSAGQVKRMFRGFSATKIRKENFDDVVGLYNFALRHPRLSRPFASSNHPGLIKREWMLGWPARLAGLDLYITAVK